MLYTITIDYFATGEGRHVWLALVVVDDKDEAIKIFRGLFPNDFSNEESWKHYSLDMEIKEISNEGLDGTEFPFFSESYYDFINEVSDCGPEMHMKFSVNCG